MKVDGGEHVADRRSARDSAWNLKPSGCVPPVRMWSTRGSVREPVPWGANDSLSVEDRALSPGKGTRSGESSRCDLEGLDVKETPCRGNRSVAHELAFEEKLATCRVLEMAPEK